MRNPVEMVWRDLESLVAEDHPARAIWALLERLDLGGFYAQVRAVQGRAGRPATDLRVVLALWVYATVEAVGSARRLAELTERDDVYRWLRGGVPLNYHLVADFRTAHQAVLNELLTDILTTLLAEELVSLKRVAQDGMRVRASAGAASFRREPTPERLRQEAHAQVERLAAEVTEPGGQASKRERAARARAAQERVDGGFAPKQTVPALEAQAITVYTPVQKPKDPTRNPYEPLKGDVPAVAAWRQRMGTVEAKAIYKERAATAECVNAQCRRRYGLQQFTVRGVNKVACVALLTVITHNLLRWLALMA